MFDDERLYHDHSTSQKLRMRQQGFGHQQRSKSLWIICPDPIMEKPLLPIRERNTPMIVRRHLYGPSGDIVEDSDGIKFIEHAVEFSNV